MLSLDGALPKKLGKLAFLLVSLTLLLISNVRKEVRDIYFFTLAE